MLNRTRNEVLNGLAVKLQNELGALCSEDGTFSDVTNGDYYNHEYDENNNYVCRPPEAVGWPPGMQEYIRRVAMATAIAVVDAVYTEQEMDAKVDQILLTDEDTLDDL